MKKFSKQMGLLGQIKQLGITINYLIDNRKKLVKQFNKTEKPGEGVDESKY